MVHTEKGEGIRTASPVIRRSIGIGRAGKYALDDDLAKI